MKGFCPSIVDIGETHYLHQSAYSRWPGQNVRSPSNDEQNTMNIASPKMKPTFNLSQLRDQMIQVFNVEEVKSACFDLNINYEGLAGEGLDGKARELIGYCLRHGSFSQLIDYCAEKRPHLTWNKPTELEEDFVETGVTLNGLITLYTLVKAYNRNRQLPPSAQRTFDADDIAYTMRETSPLVFGQIPVDLWLKSTNAGKRLAAVKYLDWLQDTEFLTTLSAGLFSESPFLQFHIMLALYSMADQFDAHQQEILNSRLGVYTPPDGSSRQYWKDKLLAELNSQKLNALT